MIQDRSLVVFLPLLDKELVRIQRENFSVDLQSPYMDVHDTACTRMPVLAFCAPSSDRPVVSAFPSRMSSSIF